MIIDLRYHLVSLTAVFLALGLGLLIGAAVLKGDVLAESRRQILDALEKQVEQLRRDNQARQAQVDFLLQKSNAEGEFARQLLPYLVKGRLSGYRIAIVEANGYSSPDSLAGTLEAAGAKVQSVTTVAGNPNIFGETGRLAEEVSLLVSGGGNREAVAKLAEANLIILSGDYSSPPDAVILVGGRRDREIIRAEGIDLLLIDSFLAKKIPVFGVEETNVLFSSMKSYQKKGISTVDNIDTVPGQVALVLAISKAPGHYGVKPTAWGLLPPLDSIFEEERDNEPGKGGSSNYPGI